MATLEEEELVMTPGLNNEPVSNDSHTDLANFETYSNSNMVNSESKPYKDHSNLITRPNKELPASELDSTNESMNNEVENSELLPNGMVNTEIPTSNDAVVSEIQCSGELALPETQQQDEVVVCETQENNEMTLCVKQQSDKVIVSETQYSDKVVVSETTREVVLPETQQINETVKSYTQPSSEAVISGTQPSSDAVLFDKGLCPTLLHSQDPNQLTPYTPCIRGGGGSVSSTPKRRYGSPSTPDTFFDQDICLYEFARMVILHDYPLHMGEHPAFVSFVKNLQPQFNMVAFNTVQGYCVGTYLAEKYKLLKFFRRLPGRVCLSLDIWTSSQSVGYVVITGHFVDSDWKLQKRVLNVVMEPYPDSDTAISDAVASCLTDWDLEGRLFSITCNQALSDVALQNLRPLLALKNSLILNGQLLIGHCIARTLSNVANDVLSSAQDIVNKIRASVKYVKTSELHVMDKFLDLKLQLQVPSERSLFIDDQTKWNTTYEMLVAATELREVFSCLDTYYPDYKGAPSIQDWKLVETLCTYLKPLYDAANILITTTHPTTIALFHEIWKLQLDLVRAVKNEDPFVNNLTKRMQEKIDKYWRDCSLVLAIAVVMDPRFKMKLVEFSFTKTFGEDAHVYVKIVEEGIHELFNEYVTLSLPGTPPNAEGSAGIDTKLDGTLGKTLMLDYGLADFDAYIMETTSRQVKSELDQYLEESLLPRVPDFDVLAWWKLNKLKYPTLSKMAQDILSIPVSAVPPDSVFDRKRKEMDQYRSSLRPDTVEALVCAKDWIQYGAPEACNAPV